jgi:general secretion pathway protein A
MYEEFYGFKEKPFSMLPDPGFLYLSKKHQAALTLLEYGLMNHVGFCVISGEPGAGKTTILRSLLERIGDDVTVGMITNTHQSFGGLLDWVLSAFDLHRPNLTHVEMHQVFMDFLIAQYAKNHTVLLIVDEAQNMKADALEELRMLSNVNSEKDQLMQVVLAGQPALRDTLRRPDLKQFAQRIAVDYHIESLGLQETCGYIQHRLMKAGATKDVFTPAACERIHSYSGGTPRLINLLCETVMVYGFADQQEIIDVELVDEMVQERMKDSVVPIVNRDIVHEENKEVNEELERDFPWIQPEGGTQGLKPKTENPADDTSRLIDNVAVPEAVSDTSETTAEKKTEKTVADIDMASMAEVNAAIDKSLSIADEWRNEDAGSTQVTGELAAEPAAVEDYNNADNYSEQPPPAVQSAATTSSSVTTKADDLIRSIHSDDVDDGYGSETRRQLKKFGIMAGVFAIVLVLLAVMLDDDSDIEVIRNEALEMQKQRDQEIIRLKQLQLEAQALKKERDNAIARAQEEAQRAKQEAERLAAEKAAAAAIAADKAAALEQERKRKLEEQKRAAAAKERERKALQAEAAAKAEARYAKREAALLAEETRMIQKRLEEEVRLKQLEEARRLELERLEQESATASKDAAEEVVLEDKKSVECRGPAARFKSGCR